jgi:hypothetical protein
MKYTVTLGFDGAFGNDILNRLLPWIWKTELFDEVFPSRYGKNYLEGVTGRLQTSEEKRTRKKGRSNE